MPVSSGGSLLQLLAAILPGHRVDDELQLIGLRLSGDVQRGVLHDLGP